MNSFIYWQALLLFHFKRKFHRYIYIYGKFDGYFKTTFPQPYISIDFPCIINDSIGVAIVISSESGGEVPQLSQIRS